MKTWIVEPRDPLIARDGRPFSADIAGARAKSLDFPFPSTTTGTVRTKHGFAKGDFNDPAQQKALINEVKDLAVHGPLLVELTTTGELEHWLFPAPADALLFEDKEEPGSKDKAEVKRLVPIASEGACTNLPADLCPVGLQNPDRRKPFGYAPRFWRDGQFLHWLTNPQDKGVIVKELGHSGPIPESRTHVGIDPDKQAAKESALFQTRGLEFTRTEEGSSLNPTRLAVAVLTDAELSDGYSPIGGERRLSHWRSSDKLLPACPDDLRAAMKESKACRVVLLTPAHFQSGFRPTWLLQERYGTAAELKAAAVPRTQVVSGWDYEKRCPKPTRRLAPAGSVYFLKLNGDGDIDQWINDIWMRCVSDDDKEGNPAQTRLDGFGLSALGVWSGNCETMEVK